MCTDVDMEMRPPGTPAVPFVAGLGPAARPGQALSAVPLVEAGADQPFRVPTPLMNEQPMQHFLGTSLAGAAATVVVGCAHMVQCGVDLRRDVTALSPAHVVEHSDTEDDGNGAPPL